MIMRHSLFASRKTPAAARKPGRIGTRLLVLTALSLGTIPIAYAQGAIPIFSPDSRHVVHFDYSPQDVFHIKTQPHMVTDLRLSPGEVMEMLILGNTKQWISADAPGNVFLKPTQPGLTTSGTLVTNLRTYQLLITSSNNQNWYQQVSWNTGTMIALQNHAVSNMAALTDLQKMPTLPHLPTPKPAVHPGQSASIKAVSNLHFDYRISGHASFRPSEVFDNGTFTWIKIPDRGNGAMPVVFVREHGEYVITNYTVKGRYLIVQQLFHKAKLRIGDRVVTITRQ